MSTISIGRKHTWYPDLQSGQVHSGDLLSRLLAQYVWKWCAHLGNQHDDIDLEMRNINDQDEPQAGDDLACYYALTFITEHSINRG